MAEEEEVSAVPASASEPTEPDPLEKKIIRQMEFYFGDRNLSRDKFLQNKIKEDEDGWVELSVLLTFSRLKALSTDCALIAGALRKSTSGLLEVSEDGLKVKRKSTDPVPTLSLLSPEVRKDMSSRTLYIKGFPKEATLDDLQDFLLQFGETEMIRMKRDEEKKFKGSLFVEFKSHESIPKVLEKKPDLKYKDEPEPLSIETKQEYFKRKDIEKKAKKFQARQENQANAATDESKEKNGSIVIRQEGAVLHFTGCEEGTTREDLKEYFRQFSTVAWVDFQKGDTEGYIRFDEEGGAKKAFDGSMANIADGETPKICGSDVTLKVLEGEDEVAYWGKMKEDQANRKAAKGDGPCGLDYHCYW